MRGLPSEVEPGEHRVDAGDPHLLVVDRRRHHQQRAVVQYDLEAAAEMRYVFSNSKLERIIFEFLTLFLFFPTVRKCSSENSKIFVAKSQES